MTYIKNSVHKRDVSTGKKTFELEFEKKSWCSLFLIVGFMLRKKIQQQTQINDKFFQPSVTYALCIIGTEQYADVRKKLWLFIR